MVLCEATPATTAASWDDNAALLSHTVEEDVPVGVTPEAKPPTRTAVVEPPVPNTAGAEMLFSLTFDVSDVLIVKTVPPVVAVILPVA